LLKTQVRNYSSHPGILPHLASDDSDKAADPRCSVLCELSDKPGALFVLLSFFWKHDVQLTSIESRPVTGSDQTMTIQMSFAGSREDPIVQRLINDLSKKCRSILVLDKKVVPWYPRHISDLDLIANRTLDAGGDLESDHPGFSDPVYRERRTALADIAVRYKWTESIPRVKYEQYEIDTWGAVYSELEKMRHHACKEYRDIIPKMERMCGFGRHSIPQAQDISEFLQSTTGFRLRPVAGLLSSRDFLNGLAFKVFFSTQYIRHSSRPLYTPEPDICHELLGHAPMFADLDFALFSQEVGLASLGASDDDIKKLATCYWHTVEFGLLKEDGVVKAYGAGVLSSFGEMKNACVDPTRQDAPKYLPWDPEVASKTEYPITTYQPTYFVAESLGDAKNKLINFSKTLNKPFYARYNSLTNSIWVDRAVERGENKLRESKVVYGS
jgi:phenylalanine-4-hydroxylase